MTTSDKKYEIEKRKKVENTVQIFIERDVVNQKQ